MSDSEIKKINKIGAYDIPIRVLFGIRAVLWCVAAGFTIHWIYWSFHLYEQGVHIVSDYSQTLRPILYKDLIATAICILISFALRSVSDKLKEKGKG